MSVRVRFAPSPTGTLHLGSARSALYNWLYARHFGAEGTYVLRIEDTDQERSTPEHVQQALRVFRWLGLDWDEGPGVDGPYAPYFQSERADLYADGLERLRAGRHVYECFCTKEQLDADRATAESEKRPLVYSGRCAGLSDDERAARAAAGEAHTIRFRAPSGTTVVNDLILGESSFDNALIGDFVIARADGSPLYNFANVIDDAQMQITHVIRGNDHISNTPKQVLMYQAFGYDVPAFAHVPMIIDEQGKKLSKRSPHASTVEELASDGYLPAAVSNGIALLGWGLDDSTTVMSVEQMVAGFDVARVNKAPARVDYAKLRHINGQHLRSITPAEFAAAYEQWRNEWLPADDPRHAAAHAVSGELAAELVQEKVEVLGDVPNLCAFLLEPFEMTSEASDKLAAAPEAGRVLEYVSTALAALPEFDVESIEGVLRSAAEELELKNKFVFPPVRFAVTGRTVTPGLWESIHALGRERALARLTQARNG
jgi:glutamyl-tRNA synthetase